MVRRPALGDDFDRSLFDSFLFDDFFFFMNGQLWTQSTDGTVSSPGDGYSIRGGRVLINAGTTDNNEGYLYTTSPFFAPNKHGVVGCAIKFSVFDEGTHNLIFGFLETAGANSLIDDGGGVMANKSCAVIYKIDGETTFRCRSGKTTETKLDTITTQTSNSTSAASPTDAFTVKIEAVGNGSEIEIAYEIDDMGYGGFKPLRDLNNKPVRHTWFSDPAAANDMKLIFGIKNGEEAATCRLTVDWAAAWANRNVW